MIDRLVADGTVALIAVAIIVAEVVLLLWLPRTRRSIGIAGIVANGLSGACLLLALYAALTGGGSGVIGVWLGLAFAAHIVDLGARLRR